MSTRTASIQHFLRSGEHDPRFAGWSGEYLARAKEADADLRQALIAAVKLRPGKWPAILDMPSDPVAFTRTRVEPMVRGLFPRTEQPTVLRLLEHAVIFLSPENIDSVLQHTEWLATAWKLANMYLDAVGAELVSDDAPRIVGLSEETTCYLSPLYFQETKPFADHLVHEAAHIFHNCKRGTIGLKQTRRREWLLDLMFQKRETFAYCCEAYSRILALGSGPVERTRLLDQLAKGSMPGDERVDAVEYVEILREACSARNGWKRILARCGR